MRKDIPYFQVGEELRPPSYDSQYGQIQHFCSLFNLFLGYDIIQIDIFFRVSTYIMF